MIKTRFIRSFMHVLPSLLIVALATTACSGQTGLTSAGSQPAPEVTANPASLTVQHSYADVVSRVSPAVVTVRSVERARQAQQFPFFNDPFFREFFGDRMPSPPQQPPRLGLGSGVIVSADGYLLTNHHVVDGALEIRIELTDNRIFSAKLVGSDPQSDLAVLKIDAADLPTLALGDSDSVRVGDVVLAVGNPLGVGQTVTSGIISAKGRSTTGISDGSFQDFLQTDAAINRGNSGGALVNTNGELIGVNSQILSPSGGNIGIGFAIPSNMARAVMDQLIKTGRVRRGMIGVNIQDINADLAASLNLPAARGAIVTAVQAGGPAEKAGVRRGDVFLAMNDQPILDGNNLRNVVAATAPGTSANFTILRDGSEQRIAITLAELPATARAAGQQGQEEQATETGAYGMALEVLTPERASRLGIAGQQGLIVTRVEPSGPAGQAGIRQGDLIQEVNRQPVTSVADFNAAVKRSGTRPALILINRGGNPAFITLRPAQN